MKIQAPEVHDTLKLWPRSISELRALIALIETLEGQNADEAAATGGHAVVTWTVWAAKWAKEGLATCTLDPRTTQGRPKRRYHATPKASDQFKLEPLVTF